ncbi:methyltransferase domain-containing protein [Pseudoxanthomonas daejeonensis]|uniref:Methyltransferase domain-containing protein n=1 Tax=Pseudoxanthomonas daejeonensis TaxID=266062 RepID=A0ABQ6ZBJ4_9GAMM|nr:methyltransferase domain-containing protein [Pseudoxanthomonas daejeonensis]KAF1696951.1 hypothetical protein CSC65_02630 [Pseudoxanthomonas daejeonensis]
MGYEIDLLQELRRDVLLRHVHRDHRVIEVGAFYRPTILPGEAQTIFADYYGTDELQSQAGAQGVNRQVAPVTIRLAEQELWEAFRGRVDWIVANHVLEHLVDPFRWLKQIEPCLNEGGAVFITLPDKRFSFDHARTDTAFAHFVADYLFGGEKSLPEHCVDAGLLYDGSRVGGETVDPSPRLDPGFIEHAIKSHHPGMHVHVFQGPTFRSRVLEPFLALGWLGYELAEYGEIPQLGEFYFILRRTDVPNNRRPAADWLFFARSQDSVGDQ